VRVTAVGDCGVDRYLNAEGVRGARRGPPAQRASADSLRASEYDRPGGITLNFAANARRLFPTEDTVGVVTALGTDPEAGLVRRAVAALGLDACLAELDGATSIQYIDRQPSGEKIFVRYEQGVLGGYRIGPRERDVIARSDVLMAVVYAQIEGFFDSVMDAPSPGLRAVDFGDLAGITGGTAIVERYRERFHLGFFGLTAADATVIDELERLARRHELLLVVTLGAEGSLALASSRRVACPAVAVPQIVDTTGAGDTFAAGFVREYSLTGDIERSLVRAAQEASAAVQRVGAFPWEE
jgi:fructoselysine 6-kinase